jgi:hypothetical protein
MKQKNSLELLEHKLEIFTQIKAEFDLQTPIKDGDNG